MTTYKNSGTVKLISINEARLLKRSMSNNIERFAPIKLKSLQEARNAIKTTISRGFSFSEDSELLKTLDMHSTIKIAQEISEGLGKIEERKNNPGEEKSKKGKSGVTKRPSNFELQKVKPTQKIGTKNLSSNILAKKKQIIGYVPKKDFQRGSSSNLRGENSCRDSSKMKTVSKESSKVLDFMQEITGGGNKKLTKDQEKGLIDRLQGKQLLKFSK